MRFAGAIAVFIFIAAAGMVHPADIVVGDTPAEVYTVASGDTLDNTGTVYVLNDGTFTVEGRLNLTGSVIVADTGRFVVDGGEFHILGDNTHIVVGENGVVEFKNTALFHYVQTYLAQHMILGSGSAQVILTDTAVDCDASAESIVLTGSSSYTATNVSAPDWKTWYLSDTTVLTLDGMNIGGDIVFTGSPVITCTDTIGIMPWLYFGSGAVVDYTFPDTSNLSVAVNLTLDSSVAGISGIPWSFTATNCYSVRLGMEPAKGSDVTVRDSTIGQILYRFDGPGTGTMSGVMQNDSYYTDTTVPVTDRDLRLVNSTVVWWKVDVVNGYDLTADHLVFSEMMVKDDSRVELYDSICEGQTIHLGAQEDAYVELNRGEVWSDVSVWQNAVMVLRDSLVDYRKGEFIYQIRNIAHNAGRLYCLNTAFGYETDPAETEPEAMDAALAMYLYLDPAATVTAGAQAAVPGSAWIKAGPTCPASFDHYTLSYAPEGSGTWTTIATGYSEVREDELGPWNTAGLAVGDYKLRLTLWTSGDTSSSPTNAFPAEKTITIAAPKDDDDDGGLIPGCVPAAGSGPTAAGSCLLVIAFVFGVFWARGRFNHD